MNMSLCAARALSRRATIRLNKLDIQCPIKQHAYGTKGSYRCILVEQKTLNAQQFKQLAEVRRPAGLLRACGTVSSSSKRRIAAWSRTPSLDSSAVADGG
jgi:hypothetical protein